MENPQFKVKLSVLIWPQQYQDRDGHIYYLYAATCLETSHIFVYVNPTPESPPEEAAKNLAKFIDDLFPLYGLRHGVLLDRPLDEQLQRFQDAYLSAEEFTLVPTQYLSPKIQKVIEIKYRFSKNTIYPIIKKS